ncbi:hypothetical protein [Jannaschia sp. CCS1]|uniref:hypothetical protein n=1 Tax=Jannaschia sp. (strain CCS1) TaxID=290400 RepID=UPI000053C2C4|nr:hypothetical protein [Jannaschia sp. CCS1]ABD54213.1 hypothetical protein Jann_1296 [Jannaschia sp. CCS1]
MKRTTYIFHEAVLAAGFMASGAIAAETMDTEQLSAIIAGNTLYVDIPAGAPGAPDGGTAPIYYSMDGSTTAQLPAGLTLIGTWRLEDGAYCIDWDNGPQNSCTQLIRGADGFIVMDPTLGEPRGMVTRIVTGNAEDL